ncbi:hypothetical protein M441DRAFT_433931 [Trichoderma asperellum CBS 433.97]|uniref:Transmembrane protein n=1 Tax=Trichoderma asperellum (strain ATCC 204424 / CBS 433.97 / NBRC 101777) TaxID=1042311 RepID=A0A2T3Z2X9_TRIA4|nr:hypothetical protein M441DRAFT_433931 [Trichoderma asperellum CBS 433.97]PTB39178.1 hypothetical protein M441DRAFT_433931 [Trichoderma asperellum CBS 433.97]
MRVLALFNLAQRPALASCVVSAAPRASRKVEPRAGATSSGRGAFFYLFIIVFFFISLLCCDLRFGRCGRPGWKRAAAALQLPLWPSASFSWLRQSNPNQSGAVRDDDSAVAAGFSVRVVLQSQSSDRERE